MQPKSLPHEPVKQRAMPMRLAFAGSVVRSTYGREQRFAITRLSTCNLADEKRTASFLKLAIRRGISILYAPADELCLLNASRRLVRVSKNLPGRKKTCRADSARRTYSFVGFSLLRRRYNFGSRPAAASISFAPAIRFWDSKFQFVNCDSVTGMDRAL
jgi:hypothetical protein